MLTPVASIVMGALLAGCYYPVAVTAQPGIPVPVTTTTTTTTTNTRSPAPPAASAPPTSQAPVAGSSFSVAQIDQMMAPIALYPDSLLSQVLMASTYPADVADAARWSKANSTQSGDAAVKAVDAQPWDPSVKSLVAFPQVIQTMGDKPDWVQNLGDAFLASSKDVLDSAQRLRAKARENGQLKTTEQQTVEVRQEQTTQQSVITIEPANPQMVYVPTYNPTVVYGTWPYPAYPPFYYYPPAAYYPGYYPGAALASGIAFGIGVAAVASLWGGCNWGGGDVNIDVNRFNNINTRNTRAAGQTGFQHNAANRRGVPYRDSRSQQQFGRQVPGAEQRGDFRGRDSAATQAQRQQAQETLRQRDMDPGQGRERLQNDAGTRERAQAAAQGRPSTNQRDTAGMRDQGRAAHNNSRAGGNADNAFRGAGRDGGQLPQQYNRGNSSRQSMGQHSGGGGRMSGGGGGARGGRR
ncbi:DUF3300 domain-containing protein [Variovorax sp. HJSM1_2]|uniref:DUF3300 domain-containing protein n=1 Tax=Variovorax sp. HJSM1_2 TaxID=3366263 RepID=UPI003BC89880